MPIIAYLFFATGVNSFITLPTLTPSIDELGNWKSLDGKPAQLSNKITVLGFPGNDVPKQKSAFFNLSQKIYNRNHDFKDFQFVSICPIGTETEIQKIVDQLNSTDPTDNWHFVFATPSEIEAYFKSLKLKQNLNSDLSAQNVFIIDKKRNLRGRKSNLFGNKTKDDFKEGYDPSNVSDVYNEMLDDVKVILAEYRLALKRNNANRKI
jgi:hypothetical protein